MITDFNLGDSFHQNFNVTEEIVNKFIELSNDKNPLHINNEVAKKKGFKSRVVQGNLQNCFISFFIGECLPTKDVMILSQTIKYKNPVFLNDVLSLNVKISGIFDSVNLIEFSFNFKNKLGDLISIGKINIKLTK